MCFVEEDEAQHHAYGGIYFYNCGPNDLPEDEIARTYPENGYLNQLNPWIEFSQDIVFADGLRVNMATNGQGAMPRSYDGEVDVVLLALGATVEPGVDDLTGYGLINLSFLADDPPYDSAISDFPLTFIPSFETTLVTGAVVSDADYAASGSISVGGDEAAYDTFTPGVDAFTADGYVAVTGPCLIPTPLVTAFTAAGYIAVTGPCQVASAGPGTITPDEYAASGSVAITAPCQVDSIFPQVSEFVAAGYIKTGGFFFPMLEVIYPTALTTAFIAAGCVEVTGECGLGTPDQPTVSAFVAFTGAGAPCILVGSDSAVGFIMPPVAAFVAAGSILIVNPDVILDTTTDTWALSGQNFEPAYFTGFNFNSFAIHQGKAYGAGPDGIYLLEGADDDGAPIHTGARIGPVNFGTDRYKRLRALRLGNCGDDVQVRVQAGEDEGYFEVDEGRVQVSSNLQGREMTIDIADFTRLDQLEIVALTLARR